MRAAFFFKSQLLRGIIKVIETTNKSIWLKNNLIKKVTNISSQLPIYGKQSTNNLDQVSNIFKKTRVAFFFKSILLGGIINILKPANKSIWLEIKPTKKLLTLAVSYQHIVNKVPIIWVKLPIYRKIIYLLSCSNLYYWEELLKLSNPQKRVFSWNWSQLKKVINIVS